ncbi:MAG: murein biosynthesis integral membrane protein MurJ [Anaerolineae bacterium]|nr:murein biosynthesis integral membrane protein MurJ [Anaerolineae bacterium]
METSQRQVARAAALIMVAFAVSRVLGLVRQIVFGAYFGTGPEMDAYVAAVRIPDAIFLVVAGGALGSAFIPLFTGRLAREERAEAWRLASAIITLLTVILVPISVACVILAPWLVGTFVAPALPPEIQARTVDVMRVMLISPTIFGISGIVMGILNAHQHFFLPAVAPIIYNLGLIGGGIVGGMTPAGAMGPAVGMVAGAVGHLIVQVPGLVKYRARFSPTFGREDPGVREVGLLIAPRMLGMAAAQINTIVISNLASRLGTGAIATLEYALLLVMLPQGIFAQAVGTAVFPTFSKQAALGERGALRDTLTNALGMLVALAVPSTVGLILLGKPIVVTMFQRGAFDAASAQAVAWALAFFAVGLVGHSALEVLGRAFYALQDTWTPALAAIGAVIVNAGLGMVLPGLFEAVDVVPLGGLALATSLAAVLQMAVLFVLIGRRLGEFAARPLWGTTIRVVVASSAMAVAIGLFMRVGPDSPYLQALLGIPIGVLAYVAFAWMLGVSQLRMVVRMVTSRAT